MSSLAYRNGLYLPATELAVPVHDAGFVWGATITDRVRTYFGRLTHFTEHAHRFRESCRHARVPLQIADAELEALSMRLVEANRGSGEVSVVWLATPGPLARFATGPVEAQPLLMAYTLPIDADRELTLRLDGLHLVSMKSIANVDPRIKHRSRLHWWIAQQQLHERHPGAEGLFVDMKGNVLETASSNIVIVRSGKLVTPRESRVLTGMMLTEVAKLAKQAKLALVHRDMTLSEFEYADEVLCTNTTFGIMPVSRVDDWRYPVAGKITHALLQAWDYLHRIES